MVRNLSEQASILGQYMAEIRDVNIQNDPIRFRTNLERIAEIMGYEIRMVTDRILDYLLGD